MNATHLTASQFTRQAWRNAGGFTTQLAIEEDAGGWLWRLSLAEVDRPGPFSDFTGYDRTLMLVEGHGMELAVEGRSPVQLRDAFRPFSFDGGAGTQCTLLDGPVKDLNLMVDRARARGTLEAVDGNAFAPRRIDGPWNLVYALRGWTRVALPDLTLSLAPGELLRIDDASGIDLNLVGLERTSRLALVHIARL